MTQLTSKPHFRIRQARTRQSAERYASDSYPPLVSVPTEPDPAEKTGEHRAPSATSLHGNGAPDASLDSNGSAEHIHRSAHQPAISHRLLPTVRATAAFRPDTGGIGPINRPQQQFPQAETSGIASSPAQSRSNEPQLAPGLPAQTSMTPHSVATGKLGEDHETPYVGEILRIQDQIVRRRQRRLLAFYARVTIFIGLPTVLAAIYYAFVATPMYTTRAVFEIHQSGVPQSQAGLGGLFSGSGLTASQDAVAVQEFLTSMDAMVRLDDREGFREHFSDERIDFMQRLPPGATRNDLYRLFGRMVTVGHDPTEGVLRMDVTAADPEVAARFSKVLLALAEERVDERTRPLREDQMQAASQIVIEAESNMRDAQQRVLGLQERLGVLDPASESSSIMSQISTFEVQLNEKRLERLQLLDNAAPNAARLFGVEGDIARLEALVDDLRRQLTDVEGRPGSLAQIASELSMAQLDLETRKLMMQEALTVLESARTDTVRQARYVALSVRPIVPDEPTQPRAIENTLITFFVFSGVYLMASLTVSILREQLVA